MTKSKTITLWHPCPKFTKSLPLLLLLVLLLALASCGPSGELEGEWRSTSTNIFETNPLGQTLIFKTNGLLVSDQSADAEIGYKVISPGKMMITEGSDSLTIPFTLEGDTLTLTISASDFAYERVKPVVQATQAPPAADQKPAVAAPRGESVTPAQPASAPDPAASISREQALTQVAHAIETASALGLPSPVPDAAVNPIPAQPTPEPLPDRPLTAPPAEEAEVYWPLGNCAPSRLRIGDSAYVSLGGTKSSLRSEPDTHSANNIIQKYLPGSVIEILDGPYCSYGILLWMVSTTQDEVGYMAEGNTSEFWMVPIQRYAACPGQLPTRLEPGGQGFVEEMPKMRNIMRVDPLSSSSEVYRIEPGRSFDVLDGPVCRDGQIWYQIQAHSNGRIGWTRESGDGRYFLAPLFK